MIVATYSRVVTSPQTQWSGIVSDNKGIHPDSELVVKDCVRHTGRLSLPLVNKDL